MIQVYSANNTAYSKNGDMVLSPLEAYTESELNGSWSATLVHPIDPDGKWQYLTEEAVVKMPSWNGEQLYRIKERTKTDEEIVCVMYPIFYDSADDCFLEDIRPTEKTGQQALDLMLAPNNKYSGTSNITVTSTAYYECKNFMEALNGEEDNAFLSRWGGEVEYDNFAVKVNSSLGADNGLTLKYGLNIQSIEENVDMTEVATRIYPKAFNGRMRTGTKYIDSTHINDYPNIKTAVVVFENIILREDATEDDLNDTTKTICDTQSALNTALAAACQTEFDKGLDKPTVNMTITGVFDLSKIAGYEVLSQVSIGLGDVAHLTHSRLGITSTARIIYLKYDAIRNMVEDIEIGKRGYDYFRQSYQSFQRLSDTVLKDGAIRGDRIAGRVDMKRANLYAQYDASTQSDVIGIIFENNDANSALYGCMAIGTQGFMIADTKNASGNWEFKTLGTARGIVADYIYTGILASMNDGSFWDLDNSRMVFEDLIYKSRVVLDEGYISFQHDVSSTSTPNYQEFGKILRAILSGNDILKVAAPNGLSLTKDNDNYYRIYDDIYEKTTGSKTETISGSKKETISTNKTETITGNKTETITGNSIEDITGKKSILVDGELRFDYGSLICNGYGALMLRTDHLTTLNADYATGIYSYDKTANGSPSANAGGSLLVIRRSSSFAYQIAFLNSSSGVQQIKSRMKYDNSFSAWSTIL